MNDPTRTYPWYALEPGVVLKRIDETEDGTIITLIEVKQVLSMVVKAEVIRILSQVGSPSPKQVVCALPGHEIYSSPRDLFLATRTDLDNQGILPNREQMLTVCRLAVRGAQHVVDNADDSLDQQTAAAFLSMALQFQDIAALKAIAYYAEIALTLADMSESAWGGHGHQVLTLHEAMDIVRIVKNSLIELYFPVGLVWEAEWLKLQRALMSGEEVSLLLDRVPDAQFGTLRSCAVTARSLDRPFLLLTFADGQLAETVNMYLNTMIRQRIAA